MWGLAAGALAGGDLADVEDDELRWADRRQPDLDDDLTGLDHLLRVCLRVALDVERLVRRHAEERAVPPDAGEEGRRVAAELRPQDDVVRLEDRPLRALQDRALDEVEQSPHVE